jgi:hypothetical protein
VSVCPVNGNRGQITSAWRIEAEAELAGQRVGQTAQPIQRVVLIRVGRTVGRGHPCAVRGRVVAVAVLEVVSGQERVLRACSDQASHVVVGKGVRSRRVAHLLDLAHQIGHIIRGRNHCGAGRREAHFSKSTRSGAPPFSCLPTSCATVVLTRRRCGPPAKERARMGHPSVIESAVAWATRQLKEKFSGRLPGLSTRLSVGPR